MPSSPQAPTLITVASGKGGVGKTSFTLNLSYQLQKQGANVLVVDADTGLANIDVQLNIKPTADLAHVLEGKKTIAEALTPTPHGFSVLCGRSGHQGLSTLPVPVLTRWMEELRQLTTFTHILLDAPAGIAPTTLALTAGSAKTLLITTPDPSSLTDAYAVVKLTNQVHGAAPFQLVTNQASKTEAKQIETRLNMAVTSFLKLPPLPHIAAIPEDKSYATAVKLHQLASISFPGNPAVEAIQALATQLLPT